MGAMPVLAGIDVLLNQHLDLITDRQIGLISNASGVTRDLRSNVDALRHTPDVHLAALFGPEHGFQAVAADGTAVEPTVDLHTGLPVYSLYGAVRKPTSEMLAGLEVLIFDIQTVGVRFYTYITTLLYAMQAAAERGLAFIVCDRPNPIGGEILEGPLLERGFESFIGPGPLPVRYGMTVGELAWFYDQAWGVGCDLTMVPCMGWKRAMWFDDTRLPWVPPSPAIPWPETTAVYPGTCLIEGTNLSEGRGTALPFYLVGAPWIDGQRLANAMNRLDLPGVRFRPVTFQPTADKWAGRCCGGVQLHVTQRGNFRPVTTGLHLLATARALYPEEFAYRESGENAGRLHVDLLIGSAKVRQALDAGVNVADLVADWADELAGFADTSREFYIYA
jgi:uncharacterized protein YbbC (DUF1343 family)